MLQDAARATLRAALRLHHRATRSIRLPLAYWFALSSAARAIGLGSDVLVPQDLDLSDSWLETSVLRGMGARPPLSRWTLDAGAIRHLERRLAGIQPRVIVECGAGVSTLVLAAYCRASSATGGLATHRTFSLEQDGREARRVAAELRSRELDAYATVLHAPLVSRSRSGFQILSYDVRGSGLFSALGGARADFLLVDGPAGPDATRLDTLPDLRSICSEKTFWMLDDALRWGDLQMLRLWMAVALVERVRICQVGKGIAEGYIRLG